MKLLALYRVGGAKGNIKIMETEEFETKKYLATELRANGFRVKGVYTEKQLEEIQSKYFYSLTENEAAVRELKKTQSN